MFLCDDSEEWVSELILLCVAFCAMRQYCDKRKPEAGTMLYSSFKWLLGLFIVQSIINSTIHFMPLNSLDHCICTATMKTSRPDRDSNRVPPGYKPQSIRMSHRGRLWRELDVFIPPSSQIVVCHTEISGTYDNLASAQGTIIVSPLPIIIERMWRRKWYSEINNNCHLSDTQLTRDIEPMLV